MRKLSEYLCDLSQGLGNVIVDKTLYNPIAINSAAYPFTGAYHILVTPGENRSSVVVIFEAKVEGSDINADMKEYCNSLLDHQIRAQLDATNGKIRDLIVAHAFSPIDLQKEVSSL